jgi:hypothetical protein
MLQGVILFIVIGTELLFHYRVELEKVEAITIPVEAEASHDR